MNCDTYSVQNWHITELYPATAMDLSLSADRFIVWYTRQLAQSDPELTPELTLFALFQGHMYC